MTAAHSISRSICICSYAIVFESRKKKFQTYMRENRIAIIIIFLPARRYASAGLCDSDVSIRPSVCLSVRPSVCHTPVLCLAERKQDREMYTI